jgi:hypothetical protein
MIINVTFDSSVGSAPAGFTSTVNAVVQYFETQFTDPITLNISVGYGEVGGQALGSGALGDRPAVRRLLGRPATAQEADRRASRRVFHARCSGLLAVTRAARGGEIRR